MAQDLKDTLQLPKTDFPMRAALKQREPVRVLHWEKIGLYAAIQRRRADRDPFVLHDGPPFTNGNVHIGTALNKILKDIINRYKSMRGFRTPYVPGWDCHGLPIEQKVVQHLPADYSIGKLRRACDEFSEDWIQRQTVQFKRLGVLGDWENAYKTKDPRYEADILRTFAAFIEADLVYRKKKPVYYSIPFETALAEAEIEYKEHVSPSIWVKFRVSPASAQKYELPPDRLSVVIWTTTPWTLPANLAVAVHPKLDYVVVEPLEGKFQGERLLVAEGCYLAFLSKLDLSFPSANSDPSKSAKIVHAIKGAALKGLVTEHPFIKREAPVVLADYVTTESGTGCVHTAPGHGTEDYETGLRSDPPLAVFCPIDGKGRYARDPDYPEIEIPDDLIGITTLETVADLEAKRTSPANVAVLKKLADTAALIAKEKYTHAYPHCWRSKTPIIYCAQYQWFVNVDHNRLRESALHAVGAVDWIPAWGENRMRSAVESRPDWCISRNRKWGVPIPAFFDAKTGEVFLHAKVVRALADKIEKHGSNFWYEASAEKLLEGVDLPKEREWPALSALSRGLDTLDVWFDSGSSHAAVLARQQGGTRWPADLYLEGSDQHRGWFQSSLWTSVVAYGRAPYRAVLTHGFIVDQERKKISKSADYEKPQTSDAYVDEYGADVIRLWIASQDFRDDIPISREILSHVSETYRLVRNTLRFQLANLFDFDPGRDPLPIEQLHLLDRWILQQAAELVQGCAAAYENHEFHRVYHLCNQFCSVSLSSIYHDIVKDRLYTLATKNPLRRSTQTAMRQILATLARILAPILTFTADEIWSFANAGTEYTEDSVHLADWPEVPASWSDSNPAGELSALLKLRARVNEAIEPKRAAGSLGKGLDAAVTLTLAPDDPILGQIRKHRGMLEELFIVSHVEIVESAPPSPASDSPAPATGAQFVKIHVQHCEELGYLRCPRCWRWVPALQTTPRGEICPRCTEALSLAVL